MEVQQCRTTRLFGISEIDGIDEGALGTKASRGIGCRAIEGGVASAEIGVTGAGIVRVSENSEGTAPETPSFGKIRASSAELRPKFRTTPVPDVGAGHARALSRPPIDNAASRPTRRTQSCETVKTCFGGRCSSIFHAMAGGIEHRRMSTKYH